MTQTAKGLDRRQFLAAAGATAAALASSPVHAQTASDTCNQKEPTLLTGNGEWTYRVIQNWGQLPAGTAFGGTHGGIATDKTGRVYISTQSDTGVLVYGPDGTFLKTIAHQFPEIHSIVHVEENGDEYFYTTVQHGTPEQNWLFVKMKIDGTVVQKITAPAEAGFKAPNEWRITAALPGPDGSIFIANGYGDSRLFRFDSKGNFKSSYSGKGAADGLMNCSHGMSVDTRYDQPLLLVCDRENRRLCHFDFDGKFVRTVAQHLRRPCQIGFYGDYTIVSELEGRVVVLDRDNVPVAFLGDNPQKSQWANYKVDPSDIAATTFSAAHGCYVDANANIYVSDWNHVGRITKLARITL
ncbi:MAG TPA: twin-arginine translocation signal domain-containing protein [Terracidiphilus sp.]|nr:twin-arginine translocation signal domain-containing protein [Terracidiphilus sp.]